MNLKQRDRLAMWSRVKDEQMTRKEASARLGVSDRQGKRLWSRYRAGGDAGLVHGLRGRPGHNRPKADVRRERALALYRERYRGFGPTLASQQMAARDDLAVDHETLRGWLRGAGLWQPRRDQRRRHPRHPRRACMGELVQLDGSVECHPRGFSLPCLLPPIPARRLGSPCLRLPKPAPVDNLTLPDGSKIS